MLVQAMTHALVGFTVTEFWASVQSSNLQHTFGVHSVAIPTAVKQVKLQKVASVQRNFFEDTVEASMQLMGIASNLWKLSFFCRIKKKNETRSVMWNIISPYISDGNCTFYQN